MGAKNIAAFGIYGSREAVDEAVGALQAAGFRSADIAVLLPENDGTKDLAHEKHTKAPEGTAAGAAIGGALGGILAGLIGASVIAIPGLGPLAAAGPVIAVLAGVGSGGVLGGIIGALVGLGTPEYEAKRYAGRIKWGGLLLSVHCDNSDWARRAHQVLERTGGEEIGASREAPGDYAVSDRPGQRARRPLLEELPAPNAIKSARRPAPEEPSTQTAIKTLDT